MLHLPLPRSPALLLFRTRSFRARTGSALDARMAMEAIEAVEIFMVGFVSLALIENELRIIRIGSASGMNAIQNLCPRTPKWQMNAQRVTSNDSKYSIYFPTALLWHMMCLMNIDRVYSSTFSAHEWKTWMVSSNN